jgi:hypothetical protein
MIECIFTLDYEIYGNGTGSLNDLVYQPGEQLRAIFHKWNAYFVNFVEVAEFERIEQHCTDPCIGRVRDQIKRLYQEGFETALHLHPQWYNARWQNDEWILDYNEYNLCTLSRARIAEIVGRALEYMRAVLDEPSFTPLSFRAGNWLFQPTQTAASVLAEHGVRVDSSVFKGGVQRNHRLDYRPASKNGYFWPFLDDANVPNEDGPWMEFPIYTEMVRPWKMSTSKRMKFGKNLGISSGRSRKEQVNRVLDFMRLRYPLKFDFCRMTVEEMTTLISRALEEDRKDPGTYRPLVAIGHTKDLVAPQAVDEFLGFLRRAGISVSTFNDIYPKVVERRKELVVESRQSGNGSV